MSRIGRLLAVVLSVAVALFVTTLIHYEYLKVYIPEPHVVLIDPFNETSVIPLENNTFLLQYFFPTGRVEHIACVFLKMQGLDEVYVEVYNESDIYLELHVGLCGIALIGKEGKVLVNNTVIELDNSLLIDNETVPIDYAKTLYNVNIFLTRQCTDLLTLANFTGKLKLVFNVTSQCPDVCYPIVCMGFAFESYEMPTNITLIFSIKK